MKLDESRFWRLMTEVVSKIQVQNYLVMVV